MKKSEFIGLVKEVLRELEEGNTTGTGASFSPGEGGQYVTPNWVGKATRAKKTLKKQGYKQVDRPKRPSNTKLFDYLN